MKIKKNQIKELIKHSLYELSGAEKAKKMGLKSVGFGNWEDPKTGQHYSTRDGKLHKVDSTDKDDVGGPAHPNVPPPPYWFPLWGLTESEIVLTGLFAISVFSGELQGCIWHVFTFFLTVFRQISGQIFHQKSINIILFPINFL